MVVVMAFTQMCAESARFDPKNVSWLHLAFRWRPYYIALANNGRKRGESFKVPISTKHYFCDFPSSAQNGLGLFSSSIAASSRSPPFSGSMCPPNHPSSRSVLVGLPKLQVCGQSRRSRRREHVHPSRYLPPPHGCSDKDCAITKTLY